MAQEAAADQSMPHGSVFRAWLEAFLHPSFATFQRWYPRMQARWRVISLLVSLLLILIAILVLIAHDAISDDYIVGALSLDRFLTYLHSPHGLFQLFSFFAGTLAGIYGFPALVAWFAYRAIGPYHLRFHVALGTLMQALPAICALLLFSAVAYFILGYFESSSSVFQVSTVLFVQLPIWISWGYLTMALSAGSGRYRYVIYIATVALYICICLLLWELIRRIFSYLGFPVL